MRVLASVFALSVITLGVSVRPACSSRPVDFAPFRLATAPARVECANADQLTLRRYEDGSARLECGHRVLVRVSVPG